MSKQKLEIFIQLLQKVKKQPSNTFDLGLIIKETENKIKKDDVFNKLKEFVDIERIVYDKSAIDEDIFGNIIQAFQNGKWIFLEIKKDVSSPILNQLKHLANYNSLQLIDFQGNEVFESKMPENSRVIVFTERDFIENQISYPHFYRLFGPILSI